MKLGKAELHIQKIGQNLYQVIICSPSHGIYTSGELTLGETLEVVIDVDRGIQGDLPARYVQRARP